jgi:hypothetical protein
MRKLVLLLLIWAYIVAMSVLIIGAWIVLIAHMIQLLGG